MRWSCLHRTNFSNILHTNKMFWWTCLNRQNTGFYEKTLTFPQEMFSNWNDGCNGCGQCFLHVFNSYLQGEYIPPGGTVKVLPPFWIAVNASSSICRTRGWGGGEWKHWSAWAMIYWTLEITSVKPKQHSLEGRRGGGRERERGSEVRERKGLMKSAV